MALVKERLKAEFEDIKKTLTRGDIALNLVSSRVVALEDAWDHEEALRSHYKGTFARLVRRELGLSAGECRDRHEALLRFEKIYADTNMSPKSYVHPKAVIWIDRNVSDDDLPAVLDLIVRAYKDNGRRVISRSATTRRVRAALGLPSTSPAKKPCPFCAESERENIRRYAHSYGWHKAADVFLEDLYIVWRALEGLPVWPSFYAAKLGYAHGGKICVNAPKMLTLDEALAIVGDVGGQPRQTNEPPLVVDESGVELEAD